ncbi:lytic transglycosylase domain-containing protein [Primorskyibacter flagellatus]|uniref:Soluble lytic murein transglycosylase n=1 Tax=Primorskyibacter flagellatus TaxID=1387277 RepID=A0A1W2AQF4_9RHOB|nr:lytic transglycosylase domain-containing protein [Primorskyibacter flagellatus]SMC62681.1 soluble lytic murein transglycosylase [Primorskyibacter flagellatus]
MWRILLTVVACMCVSLPALAQTPGAARPLQGALDAMRAGNWAQARITARGEGQQAVDVINWMNLRAGNGSASEVQDFLKRNADWPGLPYLRMKSEEAMADASDAEVLAFFADDLPQTGSGALTLARALEANAEQGAAEADIVMAWRTLALSQSEHLTFLAQYGDILKPHHVARMDMALWKGWDGTAKMMRGLVSEDRRALADARMALYALGPAVDTLIERVPQALQNDPGLAHARFDWRARKGRDDAAIELLLQRSVSAASLGEPWAWANRRRLLARGLMRKGDWETAYEVASSHHLTEGSAYAELEWIAGYTALKRERPSVAVQHFQHLQSGVDTPISLGRAGYWLGRAFEAAGDAAAAQSAYAEGAKYQTSFYGLLAAERGNVPFNAALTGGDLPEWRGAEFTQSSVFKAAVLLLAAGEDDLGERFLTHLAETQPPEAIAQMGAMMEELNRPHIQVMLGKRAAQYGIEVPRPYYALHDLVKGDYPVPKEIVLAIARRESEFDPKVVSSAGAQGLMQVMPATAQAVASRLGIAHQTEMLTRNWKHNAKLGAEYLAWMSRRFDANPVMMAASYNAGPGRPTRWMAEYGDPRKGDIDVIDWIEMIPFDETRNYVMRVTESLPVYRARLGKDPHPVPFSKELVGSTLPARPPEGE